MDALEEAKRQLSIIKRNTVEIIDEDALLIYLKESIVSKRPLRVKVGFDPTAPDLHLGHVVLLEKVSQFQKLGHKVIFLIGDFTARIGDPSGRNETRPILSEQEILENAKTYLDQVKKILDSEKVEVVRNSDWMAKMSAYDLIKLASFQTVARMLERDDFSKRYSNGIPIGIHEFLYPLIQAYDSFALKSDIELGGTDQKFNLLLAREIQQKYGQRPQIVITMPLLEGTDGVRKMSKSFGNYIGITEPPSDMFGKIMSISDELMWRYYELLSRKDPSEIKVLKEKVTLGELNPKDVKEELASEIVERFWGKEEAQKAKRNFELIFSKKEIPEDLPEVVIPKDDKKIWIVKLIVEASKKVKTNSQARRLVKEGGVSINGQKVLDENLEIEKKENLVLKIGKKEYVRVNFR